MLSIYNSLKFCRLSSLTNDVVTMMVVMVSQYLTLYQNYKILHFFELTLYLICQFWALPIQQPIGVTIGAKNTITIVLR